MRFAHASLASTAKVKLINMSEKAAFVTGGGGYLGSKLCRELVRNGYSVTAFDLNFPETEDLGKSGITNIQVSTRPFFVYQLGNLT